MVDLHDVRMRLIEVVVPQASRVGLGEPDNIVEICTRLEKYVLDSQSTGERLSDSPPKRPPGRPSLKGTTNHESNGTLGPATGG